MNFQEKVKKFNTSSFLEGLVASLILLFILRLALPQYVKYLLFPLAGILFCYSTFYLIINFKTFNKTQHLKIFIPVLLVSLFYFLSFFSAALKNELLIRTFVNDLIVFVFLLIFMTLVNSGNGLLNITSIFRKSAKYAAAIIAFLGLIKLFLQLKGIQIDFLAVDNLGYPSGASLAIDSNFFSLVNLTGMIFLLPDLAKKKSFINSIFLQLVLYILLINSFLLTSRRGLIIGTLILITLVVIWFVSVMMNNERIRQVRKNTLIFGIISFCSIGVVYYQLFFVSTTEKNKRLSFSNFNRTEFQSFVNYMTLSFKSVFEGEADYYDINNEIWESNFDPYLPFTGWAAGDFKPVDNLPGNNANIVPSGAIGALIDKNINSSSSNGSAYYYSKLFERNVSSNKRISTSVYCYVSPDFNGDQVRITTIGNITDGYRTSVYNLEKKGEWQELVTSFYADSGDIRTHLYLTKLKSSSLDSLSGHLIFAYPSLSEKIYDAKDPITWAGTQFEEALTLPVSNDIPEGTKGFIFSPLTFRSSDSLFYCRSYISLEKLCPGKRNIISILTYVPENFNGNEVYLRIHGKYTGLGVSNYDLMKKGKWQKLSIFVTPLTNNIRISINVNKILKNYLDTLSGNPIFAYPSVSCINYDPKEPITWSTKIFKEVQKLNGANVGIVPYGSKGYMIDNESNFTYNRSVEKYLSTTRLNNYDIQKNYRFVSSVYCYVSENFNGERVMLTTSGDVNGRKSDFYDLNRKGYWQKLYINNYADSGIFAPSLRIDLPQNLRPEDLNGHVIFAHPETKIFKYDPANPDSYATSNFNKEYPLTGDNSEILSTNASGYRLDKTAMGISRSNRCDFISEFNTLNVNSGDSVHAEVFAYVSEDFDGRNVGIRLGGNVKGQLTSVYNLSEMKGSWVKLEVDCIASADGRAAGSLIFSKPDVSDFSTLKGYVIFACPEIEIKQKERRHISSISKPVNFIPKFHNASFFSFLQSEDTTLTDEIVNENESFEFEKQMAGDNFSGPRLNRWRYALHLYTHEYNAVQKLIGGSFSYTGKFAEMFDDPDGFDYPHNPFLSVLLYSGIAGLMAYLWFLYKAAQYYWLYRKEYWTLGLCFLVTLFFCLFSSNSPFDPAIMGVLTILPYFIHYFHVKESGEKAKAIEQG